MTDFDGSIWIRAWHGSILSGGFDTPGKVAFADGIPAAFQHKLLPEDWDHYRKSESYQHQ